MPSRRYTKLTLATMYTRQPFFILTQTWTCESGSSPKNGGTLPMELETSQRTSFQTACILIPL